MHRPRPRVRSTEFLEKVRKCLFTVSPHIETSNGQRLTGFVSKVLHSILVHQHCWWANSTYHYRQKLFVAFGAFLSVFSITRGGTTSFTLWHTLVSDLKLSASLHHLYQSKFARITHLLRPNHRRYHVQAHFFLFFFAFVPSET